MADHNEHSSDDDWGDVIAKWTFILTAILAVLYVAAVVIFIY